MTGYYIYGLVGVGVIAATPVLFHLVGDWSELSPRSRLFFAAMLMMVVGTVGLKVWSETAYVEAQRRVHEFTSRVDGWASGSALTGLARGHLRRVQ